MMKVKLALVGLAFAWTTGHAAPIMYLTNNADGKIVLTNESCMKSTSGHLAYSTTPKANTLIGCWTHDDIGIHILWDGTDLRSYDYTNWIVINKEKPSL